MQPDARQLLSWVPCVSLPPPPPPHPPPPLCGRSPFSSALLSFSVFSAWLEDVRRDVLLDPSLQPLDGLPYIPATAPALKVVHNVRFIMDTEGILEARWKSRLGNKKKTLGRQVG